MVTRTHRGRRKELLIVESPTKARTIYRLLGQRMKVLSSKGHIADLPKSKLGVDIEHGFKPNYIRIRGKGPVIKELKQAAKESSVVYIGSDPDREGEAIAFSVAKEIGDSKEVKRVLFYEITRHGIEQAFAKPGEVDMNKVYSHRGRRVLDRLVGYLISPLLWKIVKSGLSAGRVQTVALRVIVEREREITSFKPEEYWVVKAVFTKEDGTEFETRLARIKGKEAKLSSKKAVDSVKRNCKAADFRVAEVKKKTRLRKPAPPFTTATLQQDAAQRLGFPARKTMRLAQQLFEGIELEKETVGLITYPRTDSVRVAAGFITDTREFIVRIMEPGFLPEKPRYYKDKKNAQGAHEAIRPTRIDRTPESVKGNLNREQFRLYDLIYRRFLASQISDARYSVIEIKVTGGDYDFRADAVSCEFRGFEKVYGEREKEKKLPELEQDEPVGLKDFLSEQKFTQPPSRYTEATLIKRLETNGIGRPSTYASIVSTLFDRHYVERKERKLKPTELGMVVNDVLIPRFANVFEIGFTRDMERQLDLVEEGKERWQEVVGKFYTPFEHDLEQVKASVADIRQELHKELEAKCPICGKPLVERYGRYGKFIACSRYPECKYIKKTKAEVQVLEEKCPICGKPLVERYGRYGKFIACSGYPECKYIKKTKAEVQVLEEKCPICGKLLVERHGRYGKFIACSGYPKCRYTRKVRKSGTVDKK